MRRADMQRVLFLGGNGHSAARLEPARRVLARSTNAFRLLAVQYPGFEGRRRARDFEAFLDDVARQARVARPDLVYATGIGGLVALALRARGELIGVPVVMQGAVLWGLERRRFARWMRGPLPALLRLALRTPFAQRRFRAKHLEGVDDALARAFFDGYARCASFADLFRWLRPPLLRRLERELPARPGALADLRAWWGGRDGVVGREELEVTEQALGVQVEWHLFTKWAHYPMLVDPEAWVAAVAAELARGRPREREHALA